MVDAATRARLGAAACAAAASVDYRGAGTVEFLVAADRPDEFFFIEMNTRLQVEHPVTELVTGLDLVELQLRVAAGETLGIAQDDVHLAGHAIEARVYAETPSRGFLPATGSVLSWAPAPGVRTDSAVETGSRVGSDYDPMIAKVIACGADRAAALAALDDALAGTVLLGVDTNIAFLRALLADDAVRAGDLDTGLIDRMPPFVDPAPTDATLEAAASAVDPHRSGSAHSSPPVAVALGLAGRRRTAARDRSAAGRRGRHPLHDVCPVAIPAVPPAPKRRMLPPRPSASMGTPRSGCTATARPIACGRSRVGRPSRWRSKTPPVRPRPRTPSCALRCRARSSRCTSPTVRACGPGSAS